MDPLKTSISPMEKYITLKESRAAIPATTGPSILPKALMELKNPRNSALLSGGVFTEMNVETPLKKAPNALPRKIYPTAIKSQLSAKAKSNGRTAVKKIPQEALFLGPKIRIIFPENRWEKICVKGFIEERITATKALKPTFSVR